MARKQPVQTSLGLVAPVLRVLSPSQRELVRRSGSALSIQQQQTARRRARADELADVARVIAEPISPDVAALMPKLRRMK